ncbi:MAG: hypothetical protein KDA65_10180 [Planctomycetaceae bacterium]|nr:hypothetical protein [Planctomycetaceae bacterium]
MRISALSVFADIDDGDCTISVHGEIEGLSGTSLSKDVEISAAVYDAEGRMIALENTDIDAETFFESEPFAITMFNVPLVTVGKVKVAAKKSKY